MPCEAIRKADAVRSALINALPIAVVTAVVGVVLSILFDSPNPLIAGLVAIPLIVALVGGSGASGLFGGWRACGCRLAAGSPCPKAPEGSTSAAPAVAGDLPEGGGGGGGGAEEEDEERGGFPGLGCPPRTIMTMEPSGKPLGGVGAPTFRHTDRLRPTEQCRVSPHGRCNFYFVNPGHRALDAPRIPRGSRALRRI